MSTQSGGAEGAPEGATFEQRVVALCRVLEAWQLRVRNAPSAPDDFPDFDWKAGRVAVVAYLLLYLLKLALPHVPGSWFGWAWFLFLAVEGVALFYLLRACRMLDPAWWRALRSMARKRRNYPFTPLIGALEADFRDAALLQEFETATIGATAERLALEEAELRERLGAVIGTPSAYFAVIAVVAACTAWERMSATFSLFTLLLFVLSAIATFFGAYSSKLRFSLLELVRCRAFLALELSRRRNGRQ